MKKKNKYGSKVVLSGEPSKNKKTKHKKKQKQKKIPKSKIQNQK